MDPKTIIGRNSVCSPEFDEDSFTSILHEESIWQQDQYWLLEWALYALVLRETPCEEMHEGLFRIFSYVLCAMGSHLDPNDQFAIKNLELEKLYAFRERFKMVFEGFFAKRMPDQSMCFDEINPLLIKP
ncbi:hypothetical protein B2G74_00195 [Burkholderia sp. A27]|nr:hypothetical protein B2G74_00195 [Burkholderia sp. A27]